MNKINIDEGITCVDAVVVTKNNYYGIYDFVDDDDEIPIKNTYDDNKREYRIKYYKLNRDKIMKKNRQLIRCKRCNLLLKYCSLINHLKTKRCSILYKNRVDQGEVFTNDDLGIDLDNLEI